MKRPFIVQAIKSALYKVAPTAEVILYGSEARGDAHANSPLVYTRKQWYDRLFRTPFFINVMNEGVRLQ